MTRLGDSNPLVRLGWVARGLLERPAAPSGQDPGRIRVIGHRGMPRQCPENTLESFAAALDAGADGIETDVCATRDGRFVLWHDNDPNERLALLRQLGAERYFVTPDVPAVGSPLRRRVCDLTLAELLAHYGYTRRESLVADFADGDTQPRVRIVTLDDFFGWAFRERRLREVCLDVKLRADETVAAGQLLARVRDAIAAAGENSPRFHLLSPQREIAEVFLRGLAGDAGNGFLDAYPDFELAGALDFARRAGVRRVSLGAGERAWPGFRAELARIIAARDGGTLERVVVWTVDRRSRLEELVARRVDGILTDEVGLLRELVDEAQGARGHATPRGTAAQASGDRVRTPAGPTPAGAAAPSPPEEMPAAD